MGSRYKAEVTIRSARDLKNVNWRKGDLHTYVVVWIDSSAKSSTKVDVDYDTNPAWDEKLIIPLPPNLTLCNATIHFEIVNANADERTDPLVGSARLPLSQVVDEAGIGGKLDRTLKLRLPSGRAQGKLYIRVSVKDPLRYNSSYDWLSPARYSYGRPASAARPTEYPYGRGNRYEGSQPAYGQAASASGSRLKLGMGTGLAVEAVASALNRFAFADDVDYLEDEVEDDYYGQSYSRPGSGSVSKHSKFRMGTGLAVGAVEVVRGRFACADDVDYSEDEVEDDYHGQSSCTPPARYSYGRRSSAAPPARYHYARLT